MTPPLDLDLLRRIVVVGFTCLALAAPAAADGKRIATEDEFRAHVVDRPLTRDRTVLRYAGDGRISGAVRGSRKPGSGPAPPCAGGRPPDRGALAATAWRSSSSATS